jgi:folate-binding protein YgfZ
MASQTPSPAEQHEALHANAFLGDVAPRSTIVVTGADRASYLHGLLTNDIKALAPGRGCYAAWLTPQGRMITDLYVYELGDAMLLDVPADLAAAILQRLDQFLFGEDVQLGDVSTALGPVAIHGPAAPALLRQVLDSVTEFETWTEHQNAPAVFGGAPAIVARMGPLGITGFCVYTSHEAGLRKALEDAGATPASPDVIEAARIEAGYPVFGIDMTDDTIPLEAGIEDRAISFTKGCYVGQEVIIRVLHRGHGRVARRLVGLKVEGTVPPRGARIHSSEREIGHVTSAALSPTHGPIAMGYVHRDFTTPGTRVEVEAASGHAPATVSELPFPTGEPA